MYGNTREFLIQSGWFRYTCTHCNYPSLEFSGDTNGGVDTVKCPDCGSKWERLSPTSALAQLAAQFQYAVESENEPVARAIWTELVAVWANGDGLAAFPLKWIVTRRSIHEIGADDDTPF